YGNILAIDLNTDRGLQSGRMAHVVQAVEHGSKAEKLALRRLVDYDLLVVLINSCNADLSGDKNVSAPSFIADFVNSLPGGKLLHLYLAGQNGGLIVIQKGKQRNIS